MWLALSLLFLAGVILYVVAQLSRASHGSRPIETAPFVVSERGARNAVPKSPPLHASAEELDATGKSLLVDEGDSRAAEVLFRQALDIRLRSLGPEHPQTADSLTNLGAALLKRGEFEAARPLLEAALAVRGKVLGSDNRLTAQSLHNLALLFKEKRDFQAAERLLGRAVDISIRVLGHHHLETAGYLNNLALALQAQGKLEEAEGMLRDALAIRKRQLGKEHPLTVACISNLNILQSKKERLAVPDTEQRDVRNIKQEDGQGAIQLAMQNIENCSRDYGAAHPKTALAMFALAKRLVSTGGDHDQIEPIVADALGRLARSGSSDKVSTASCLEHLLDLLDFPNLLDHEKFSRWALPISEATLGTDAPETLRIREEIRALLREQGRDTDFDKLVSRGDFIDIIGFAKAVLTASGEKTLTPEGILVGAVLADRQNRLFETVPLLQVEGDHILAAGVNAGLRIDDVTGPTNWYKLPLDDRVKRSLKRHARGSLHEFLSDLFDPSEFTNSP